MPESEQPSQQMVNDAFQVAGSLLQAGWSPSDVALHLEQRGWSRSASHGITTTAASILSRPCEPKQAAAATPPNAEVAPHALSPDKPPDTEAATIQAFVVKYSPFEAGLRFGAATACAIVLAGIARAALGAIESPAVRYASAAILIASAAGCAWWAKCWLLRLCDQRPVLILDRQDLQCRGRAGAYVRVPWSRVINLQHETGRVEGEEVGGHVTLTHLDADGSVQRLQLDLTGLEYPSSQIHSVMLSHLKAVEDASRECLAEAVPSFDARGRLEKTADLLWVASLAAAVLVIVVVAAWPVVWPNAGGRPLREGAAVVTVLCVVSAACGVVSSPWNVQSYHTPTAHLPKYCCPRCESAALSRVGRRSLLDGQFSWSCSACGVRLGTNRNRWQLAAYCSVSLIASVGSWIVFILLASRGQFRWNMLLENADTAAQGAYYLAIGMLLGPVAVWIVLRDGLKPRPKRIR